MSFFLKYFVSGGIGVNSIYNSPVYKRSRGAYTAQCAFEYLITILVTDAFLAKLLTHMGFSDAVIGVIASLTAFSFLFQLLSIYLMAHLRNTKRTVMIFSTASQMLMMSLYLVPFIPVGVTVKTVIVVGFILLAYICQYVIMSVHFKWANSYVDPTKRGEYSAVKEMISLVAGIVFTLIAGQLIDYYEGIDNLRGGFLLIASMMLILSICNFACLMMIKNEVRKQENGQKYALKDVLSNTLGNRDFVNVIVMTALWEIGRYMTFGFLGTFKTSDLLLSVGTVQIINVVANLFRLAVSKPFGRYADRTSYASAYRLALLLAAASFVFVIFCTPKSWWCIIVFTILFNVSLAGSNQNGTNITYNYVKDEYIVQAIAIKQSIVGVLGFGASLIGSKILEYVQQNGNTFMGMEVYGQQLLAGISLIFVIAAVVFNKAVVEKQKRMIQ